MPVVDFLTDDEGAAYGRFAGPPAQADLERVFFLDDEDRALVGQRRGEHMRIGFAIQLVTVRWLGTFLEDPLDVPGVVLEFVAEQLGVEDPSQVKRYTERRPTPFDHQQEIRQAYQWKDFASVEGEFVAWVAARSWMSGDGPKAIFTDGVGWLRERKVLLPGVTTLARLVAKVRDDTTRRLWGVLEGLLTIGQRYVLDQLLEVPPGSRVSDLERWRKGVPPRASGPTIIKALDQVAEILGLELAALGAEARVPQRRLGELAKYGMRADASALRRHGDGRRLATLLATVRHLESKSIDDTLELLDLLMATELLNKAETAANKEKVRKHPKLARASARLAVAVQALFESDGWGGPEEEVRVAEVWEAIETVISRADLRAALVLVNESVPPADAADPDGWRTELVGRYTTVSGFLKVLPEAIAFGANAEGTPVLEAMKALPDVLAHRSRLAAPLIPGRLVDAGVVSGPWKRLVFGHPAHEDGSVNRHAYAFCVLEQFWRGLKRREIYAGASTKWRNPQAELLEGTQWEAIRPDTLTALSLPGNPDALLAEHARTLDAALREVGGRLAANPDVGVDEAGKIHLTGVKAIEEPPSLVDLRARTTAMLPRVDLPEAILEVMSWVPELADAFTAVSGGRSRLKDLPVSIAACLTAHPLNVGYRPIAKKGVEALERSRLSHVYQNYFRPETLSLANAPLVDNQAGLPLAQAWGGGMVAAVDGMRFVVPVPAAFARPNRKYFGSKRGMTWLNAMNDRGMGRGAKVVSGTVRDSLHMVDVIFGLDGGDLPEIVVSDTGSYSDLVFGLLELLGISYRPALADLPDQKGWRISPSAGYGPLNTFARGKTDLRKIRRNWEDILRVVASIYTGTVRAYDVVTMLQRDGHPTALGEAIASYGRIFKTLHILQFIDVDETYRRDIKDIRNLQENRHSLARKICHGKKGELYHRYERGLENQLGALGLVLNCATLWTTVYLDAAVRRLRAQGYPVREEDMARLSPFVHSHLGVHGTTDKQNTQRQHDALDSICLKVFEEKTSGKLATDDRPALLNALGHIRDGDMLTVQEVDRLGRNLLEGLIVLNDLFQRGVGVKVLEGIAAGEHTERSLILDLALALAEDRRRDITRKTRNGLEAARRRGRVGGRRPVVDHDKRAAILARRQRGESIRTIAAGVKVSVGVVHKTLAGAKDAQAVRDDHPHQNGSDDETGPPRSLTSPAVRRPTPYSQPSSAQRSWCGLEPSGRSVNRAGGPPESWSGCRGSVPPAPQPAGPGSSPADATVDQLASSHLFWPG